MYRPDLAVQVAFTGDPNDPNATPTWSDLTSQFLTANAVKRGRQYELDQNQAGQPTIVFNDPNEYLNPANTGSPYFPNVVPFRQAMMQAVWPNPAAGNLLNTGAQGVSYDPSFESYTTGAAVSWLTAVGGTTPVIGTTTPHTGSKDVTWTVVNGATVQGVSWVLPCIPGRQYATSAYVRQSSASTQQIAITGVGTGSSTSTTGAYVRLTVTFAATQPSHTVTVQTTGTAVAGTVLLDDVQHEPGASANAFTTTGSVIYSVFRGYAERWPNSWLHQGFLGHCESVWVDAFAPQTKTTLAAEYPASLAAKAPAYTWTLGESSGATLWVESSGNGGPSLTQDVAKYGAGTAPASGSAITIPGDPGATGVTFTPGNTAVSTQAATILGTGPLVNNSTPLSLPPTIGTSWALTACAWVQVTSNGHTQVILSALSVQNSGGLLYLEPIALDASVGADNHAFLFYNNQSFGVNVASSALVADGKLHHVAGVVQQNSTNTILTIYVDGQPSGTSTTATASLGGMLPAPSTSLLVGGFDDTNAFTSITNGVVSNVSIWATALSAAQILDLYNAGQGYPGELSGTRVGRYLGYGWVGTSNVDAGQSVMGASNLASGTTLLSAIQDVTTTENGDYWADAKGVVQFAGRSRRYLATTSMYTFGENAAGGEFPYQENLTYDDDPTLLYNSVTVTNSGTGGVVAKATDAASIKKYFTNNYPRTINVQSQLEAIDAANYLLNQHSASVQRVSTISLDPVGNPSLWPVVLSLEVGMRVTVKRRAKAANSGAGITISGDYFVESVEHSGISMEAGTWTTTLMLSPADQSQVGIFDSAAFGQFDSFVFAY